MAGGGGRRGLLRAALYLGYVGIVSAALLEASLRWLLPQPLPQPTPGIYRPDPVIGWRRNANVRVVANTGERDVEVCTDERGDRIDCEAPPRRPEDCSARILVLGDSFVEALAVPYRETVWSRLEHDTGACLFVAGVGGYWPQQYAQQAHERLRETGERFDLVIVDLFAGNDFTDDADWMPGPEQVAEPSFHLLPHGLSLAALVEWLYPFNEWLEARSHLYVASRYAIRRLFGDDDVQRYGVPPTLRRSGMTEKLVGETTRVVGRIGEEARAAHVPLLVVVIPVANQVLDPHAEELGARFPALAGDLDMDLVAERFVPGLARLPGVQRVVDLLPYLRAHAGAEAWGRRDPHFSPAGHALWFEAIAPEVRDLLARRRG